MADPLMPMVIATSPSSTTPLNADHGQRVLLHAAGALWQDLPQPGLQQRMLERSAAGPGQRSTRLLRCAPGAALGADLLEGGAEILVLEGGWADASGEHPAGCYLRWPPGSAQPSWSARGCLLFVKQGQFASDDQAPLRLCSRSADWQPGSVPGLSVLLLHAHGGVQSLLLRSAPNTWFDTHSHPGGEEILVLDGVLHDDLGRYPRHSWVRSPRWSRHAPHTGAEGALSFVRLGHLRA